MNLFGGISLASLVVLGGCASVPDLPPDSSVDVSQLVDRIQCELYSALRPYALDDGKKPASHPWLMDWAAAYTLTLKTNRDGSLTISDDIKRPITDGFFTSAISGTVDEKTVRTGTLQFAVYVEDLVSHIDSNRRCRELERSTGTSYYFSSGTGLKDWIDRTLNAYDAKSDLLRGGGPTNIGQELEFAIKTNTGIGGTWSFLRATVKSPLSLSRTHTHNLKIALARKASTATPKVRIENVTELANAIATASGKPLVVPPPSGAQKDGKKSGDLFDRTIRSITPPPNTQRFRPVDPGTLNNLNRALDQLNPTLQVR